MLTQNGAISTCALRTVQWQTVQQTHLSEDSTLPFLCAVFGLVCLEFPPWQPSLRKCRHLSVHNRQTTDVDLLYSRCRYLPSYAVARQAVAG